MRWDLDLRGSMTEYACEFLDMRPEWRICVSIGGCAWGLADMRLNLDLRGLIAIYASILQIGAFNNNHDAV